jgi:S1-C subfamily serine protease
MLNKTYNKDINVIFETASMKTLSEAGENSQDLYLKMYPTYDESENSKIVSQNSNNWKSSGTGFFIDKKGYIATNHHVIDKAKNIQVEINRNSYNADVVIYDEQNDLAILKINDNTFIPLQNLQYNFKSETSDVGTSVFALGFPLTSLLGEEIKYTTGAISSKSGMKGDITTYQISVPIQPGNSGGPLFDNDGNLIGITSSGINRKLNLTENVNYAIKTKYLKLLIDEMNEKIQLPNLIFPKNILLTKKIKSLEKGVVLIKVK